MKSTNIIFKPLSDQTWNDLELLFGDKGACGGCWCMWWRMRNKDYESSKGNGNKEKLFALVKESNHLGILAYDNEKPVGWCSISPRSTLTRLETSRLFKPEDNANVWGITCLFIIKDYRKKGISIQLIEKASEYAFENGAACIESYPLIPKKKKTPDVFAYVGLESAFNKASFKVFKRPSESRLIMRKEK